MVVRAVKAGQGALGGVSEASVTAWLQEDCSSVMSNVSTGSFLAPVTGSLTWFAMIKWKHIMLVFQKETVIVF